MEIVNVVNQLTQHATKRWEPRTAPVDCFCVHHSATAATVTLEAIAKYHVQTKDMPGIQYHYVIGADGVIYQTQPDALFVWHGNDWNTGLGVCLLGDFTLERPTSAQIAATRWLLAEKRKQYGDIRLVGHREAAHALTACPGDTWAEWRGELEQEVIVAGSRLGIQVQNCGALNGPNGAWVKRHAREGGVTHALLIDPDVLSGDPWPGVKSMGRLWFNGDPDKDAIARGAAGARDYVEMCKPRWAKAQWIYIWHPPNEPYTGNPHDADDLDPMRRLAEFSAALVRLANAEGIRMAVGAFATGTPAGPPANPVPTIEAKWRIFAPAMAIADALVVHEYGMDTLAYTAENEWHVGAYERGVAVAKSMGLRVPLIWVGEHGVDRAGNPQTDGWRVKLSGDEALYMSQLAARDVDYAADPLIEAVTPFTWLDWNWPSFTITESMSERIMAHRRAVAGQPLPEPEPEPVGALVNGDFEGTFSTRGAGELYVADGWTPFWADPPAKWYGDDVAHYDFRPEYKRCGGEATGPDRAVSGHGQQWFNTYAGHRAGIWQRVAAMPGQQVTVRATMSSWHSKDGHDDPAVSWAGKYAKRVGLDPTGGVDWQAASVVWSETSYANDAWVTLEISAVAQSAAVTVFVYGEPAYAYKHNNCYVDDVVVTVEGETVPPAPVDLEAAIGDAIQAHIIPLNPNAALEKAGAALGLLPASNEVRDVAGYVAQAFRRAGEEAVQHIAYCADGDWGNITWFERAN